jgi:two-component system sensor histidine kinase CiaH
MRNMFTSARIKLTLFYLAILVAFCFVLTLSIRVLAEREYMHSNMIQRGEVRNIILRLPGSNRWPNNFVDVQDEQAAEVRSQLNQDMVFINVVALIVGGVLSYWFAGRTLKPIEEAHMAQARFASDASHELRTPLTNLRLENEVFLRQKQFTEAEARDLIKSNLEEVQRLEGLSSNLLALTQYGHTPLRLSAIPAKSIIQAATKVAGVTAEAKHVTLAEDITGATVRGHHDSLVQLLGILIDNAIKYGPEGGTVTVGGRRDEGYYLFWVQDQGPGIDEKDSPYIFDRLYRGDKARSSANGGYGLGLSLAKAIASANAAEVRVRNTENAGACFMVRLPLAK